jgi:hypothetical protein
MHNYTKQSLHIELLITHLFNISMVKIVLCSITGACVVKNMLARYLKYHKAGLTPTTPVTSIAIFPVKMSIGRKSLSNLRSEMIFLQGKPVFYIFLPSTPPYWQIILRFCWQWTKAEICRTRPTFALLPLRCPLSAKSEDYLSVWGCRW